jgi:hypothetical protein
MSILFVIVLSPYAHALKALSLRRGKRLARHCAVKVCGGLRSVSSFGTGVKSVTSGPDLFDKGAFGTKSVRKIDHRTAACRRKSVLTTGLIQTDFSGK